MEKIKKVMGLSILTSIASKSSGIIYQTLSVPLLAKVLGAEDFGLLLVYSGLMSWLSLFALGMAPSITNLASNKNRECELPAAFISSMCLMLTVFVIMAVILYILIPHVSGYSILFSLHNKPLFWCAYTIFSLNIILSISDAVNQGQQRQHINNISFSVGNFLNIAFIYLAITYSPYRSLVFLFVISQLGFLITKITNSIFVSFRMKVVSIAFSFTFLKELIKNSGAFIFVQIAVLISQQGIVILCLEKVSGALSGELGLVFRAYVLLGSVIAMINQPLWPLINSAISEGNINWVKRLYKKLLLSYLCYGLFIVILISILGKNIFDIWTSNVYLLTQMDMILIGIHFFLICLNQGSVVILMGMASFHTLSKILMLEAALSYVSIYLVIACGVNIKLATVLSFLIASTCLTSVWLLPRRVLVSMRGISG